MADNPQQYPRATTWKPVPYTTSLAQSLNRLAINAGMVEGVVGWHCTVSDQFILKVGGGKASPTILEFPITYDGVWVKQFPTTNNPGPGPGPPAITTYFLEPTVMPYIYLPGPTQPAVQKFPGWKGVVQKVSVEINWIGGPATVPYDPADFTRWFWKKNGSYVPGAIGRPCQSRTLLGSNQVGGIQLVYNQLYFYPTAAMPPIFLEQGDQSYLRIENYTEDISQVIALSMSVSGIMWGPEAELI